MTMLYTFYDFRTHCNVDGLSPVPRVAIHNHTIYPIPDCAVAVTVSNPEKQPPFVVDNGKITTYHLGRHWRYTEAEVKVMVKTGVVMDGFVTLAEYRTFYSPKGLAISVTDPNDSYRWYDIGLFNKSIWDEVGVFFSVGPEKTVIWAQVGNGQRGEFGTTARMATIISDVFDTEVTALGDWGQIDYRLGGRYELPDGVDQATVQSVLLQPIHIDSTGLNDMIERQLSTLTKIAEDLHSSASYNTVGTLLTYGTTEWRKQLIFGKWKSFIVPLQHYDNDLEKFSEQLTGLLPPVSIYDLVLCAHLSPVKPTLGTLEVHYRVGL